MSKCVLFASVSITTLFRWQTSDFTILKSLCTLFGGLLSLRTCWKKKISCHVVSSDLIKTMSHLSICHSYLHSCVCHVYHLKIVIRQPVHISGTPSKVPAKCFNPSCQVFVLCLDYCPEEGDIYLCLKCVTME